MLLVTKTRYFGREVGPSLALFVETKTNDFRQEIKPPAVLLAKETSFFWWQKTPAIFGEVRPFLCWPKLCISLGMEGHLEPCHWPSSAMLLASKTSDFFIGIWSIFGHFCANKMAIFSQEIGLSPAALLAKLTASDRSPTIPRHFVATRRDILSQTMKFLCQILSRAQPQRYDKRDWS